jgi:RNA recognition motif-containing protein
LEERWLVISNFNEVETDESVIRTVCEIPDLDRIDMSSLREKFEQFGEIRDVRSNKNKEKEEESHFIEFWDLRDSEKAYRCVQFGKLFEERVQAGFARPDGCWKDPKRFIENRLPIVARRKKAILSIH